MQPLNLTFLTVAMCASLATATAQAPLAVVAPIVDCSKLAQSDLTAAVGAKTLITAAVEVKDAKPAAYCRVTGTVEPEVKFEVRLPLAGWTQRFVQTGCGGLCGSLNIRVTNAEGCYPADHGELALASTDMGHTGGIDGKFGEKDYRLRVDFAYRGVHVTTLAAKALIRAFYGNAAKYSYFTGCSDGGREALMEAQRYPEDFQGITAGAPAMNFTTQNTFYHGWNALKNTAANGQPILTSEKMPLLHRAAIRACDAADGLEDGLISDPFSCHFDPGTLACKAGVGADCLAPNEVQAARDIYAGAHDAEGRKYVLGGPLPGSELGWPGVFVPAAGSDRMMSPAISTGTLKYLAYRKNPPAEYQLQDLRFTPESFAEATEQHGLYDSTDPDLRPFAKAGGKLILWHGYADQHISPLNSIAYYTALEKLTGTRFARLYLFPGGGHCGGGEGPFRFDLLSAIMAWVEQGQAPAAIVASHAAAGAGQKVDRTRPVYPYPLTAKYKGTGSIDEAANFTAGPAKPVSGAMLNYTERRGRRREAITRSDRLLRGGSPTHIWLLH